MCCSRWPLVQLTQLGKTSAPWGPAPANLSTLACEGREAADGVPATDGETSD
jgi:hypothetical protein